MLIDTYAPTTQKALFHKDVVAHIRKWIQNIQALVQVGKPVRHILFLYGPIGCAKTVTVNILFRGFNVYHIDPTEMRSNEKINELAAGIAGFNDKTLANIDRWNHKNRQDTYSKNNIVVVDNIELCEKSISSFIDTVHNKYKINTPIVLICNNPKLKDLFISQSHFTLLEFGKPSLLELTKLVIHINQEEDLKLTKPQIKSIIEHSEFDARQLFFILEQLKQTKVSFDDFIVNVERKHVDIDLTNKLIYLFDGSKSYDIEYTQRIAASEPSVIANGIYQNYLDVIDFYNPTTSNNTQHITKFDTLTLQNSMQCSAIVAEKLSLGNMIHQSIFSEQSWDLFDHFTATACVKPSYHIKQLYKNPRDKSPDTITQSIETGLFKIISPFKDVSSNFINSFAELRQVCVTNSFDKRLNPNASTKTIFYNIDIDTLFHFTKMLIRNIKLVSDYFDANKRGKNTSKQEKIDLCNNITDPNVQTAFDHLTNHVYHYYIFEVDIDDLIVNHKQYTDDFIQKNVNRIDLRMLKRLLNIFTFDDSNKSFKSHVEAAVKFKILQRLVADIRSRNDQVKQSFQARSIEALTEDLSSIWNI
uniref:AAA+ ATPase domain-containing protein n=1 Tax=viral metagenome TaxID=1070528 RepID=A0A6C0H7J3_9ZZZZ